MAPCELGAPRWSPELQKEPVRSRSIGRSYRGPLIPQRRACRESTRWPVAALFLWAALAVTGASSAQTISVIVDASDRATAVADILAGTVLGVTAETVSGAIVSAAEQVPLREIRILTELVLADGRVLIQFTANILNATTEGLRQFTINLVDSVGFSIAPNSRTGCPFAPLRRRSSDRMTCSTG